MPKVTKLIYSLVFQMSKLSKGFVGLAIGFLAGILAAFVRADHFRIHGTSIPYGIVLALATVLSLQLWLTRHFQARIVSITYAVGWIAATIYLGSASGTTDLALPSNSLAAAYVLLGAIGVSMFAALPVLRPVDFHANIDRTDANSAVNS